METMNDEAFITLVDKGVAALGPTILARIKNIAIVVADEPTNEQRELLGLEKDAVLFGLYEGVPLTERGFTDEPLLPDKITIFKRAILDAYNDPADVARCVENTVWHEVAHHFGHDEEWVAIEEEHRGKTQ
jgi:predicted Zn-dependent protease with MMP-like domain